VVTDVTKLGTSATPTVEELMKKLEKLNVELKKLKTKDKKDKNIPLQVKMMTPHMKRKSNKLKRKKKKRDKSSVTLCLLFTITWLALSLILMYPLARLYPALLVSLCTVQTTYSITRPLDR
jgi:predicted RNase H-like nuclease (RuvC/YqgF family)